ncbi:hypothetical protein WJX72_007869 [[Myrmecia] bisecta]|uniref:VTT domain-containing protein n=1 Tax=[Myrmecia] bisecta TaxID=41462 RepID=A0AAW1PA74_9CHLO
MSGAAAVEGSQVSTSGSEAEPQGIVWTYLLKPQTALQHTFCLLFWLALVAASGVLIWWGFPKLVDHAVTPALKYIERHLNHVEVAAIVVACLAIAPLFIITSSVFVWLAAAVLGFWVSFAVVTVGTAFGMALPFLLGRRVLKDRIHRWADGKPRMEALLVAVKEAGPFKVVLLMRCGPAPYSWLNYCAAIPKDITFLPYMAASLLGQAPNNAIECYLGKSIAGLSDLLKGKHVNAATIVSYALGITASVVIAVGGYMYASRALEQIRARAALRQMPDERLVAVHPAGGAGLSRAERHSTEITLADGPLANMVGVVIDSVPFSQGRGTGSEPYSKQQVLPDRASALAKPTKGLISVSASANGQDE